MVTHTKFILRYNQLLMPHHLRIGKHWFNHTNGAVGLKVKIATTYYDHFFSFLNSQWLVREKNY